MEQELIKLGFTENEAKVYLGALSLGISSAGDITKQAGVKRPTTYLALEHLIKEGLVSEVANSKEKLFKAEEPEKLQRLTKKMRKRVIEAELKLDELMPGLKAIQKKMIEAPKVTFYQGISGVKNVMEECSESRNPWYFFGASEEIIKTLGLEQIGEIMSETDELREKAGRPTIYFITDKGIQAITHFRKSVTPAHQMKFLPQTVKPRSALIIYESKLAVINISELPFVAVVESREVMELVKMMFMMIWQSLPEEKRDGERKYEERRLV